MWIILVCDRYSAYPCWAKGYPKVLLAFCWAHVRRDFLDAAKAWPALATWMHAWVEAIGELYHLNGQRLEVWDQELPLQSQSPQFQARHQLLSDQLAAMAKRRDLCLEDTRLQSAQQKVLNSLKHHWSGLTVFLDHPQTPMDNNRAENSHRNPVTGRKNDYGLGAVWSAQLAAMLFSILQTLVLWGLNPRHWLHAFLTACAENGGQPLRDMSCRVAMLRIEKDGLISLPPPRGPRPQARLSRRPETDPQAPLQAPVHTLPALQLSLVGERADSRLWNEQPVKWNSARPPSGSWYCY